MMQVPDMEAKAGTLLAEIGLDRETPQS